MDITPKDIIEEAERLTSNNGQDKIITPGDDYGILKAKPINTWINEAKSKGRAPMLFDEFWFKDELSILFGDTNCGKSVLAYQAAQAIASGIDADKRIKTTTAAQSVCYLDFELSSRQLQNRYSNEVGLNPFQFSHNLQRVELNVESLKRPDIDSIPSRVLESLEGIVKTGVKVFIIDNITMIGNDNTDVKNAKDMMLMLNIFKKNNDVSMLVLAHTPKISESEPITKNSLAGSRAIANFCDSIFAIGVNQNEPNSRYLKQIKVRESEFIYHAGNVIKCDIKKDVNFLKFMSYGVGDEFGELKTKSQEEKETFEREVIRLYNQHPGWVDADIAKELGASRTTVWRITKKHEESLSK